jgi:2-methylisocitrate lyase-like PEP mutase family enzyme
MPDITSKGAVFRALHAGDRPFIIPNPWDVGSARILAVLGFKALATTSAGFAFSLGRPDGGVTRAEALVHCREIVNATDLPVSADLEKGFGDSPESVAETVRLAADTGLAGCSIEDHTGDRASPIFDFGLAVERVAAAAEAARRASGDFVLTARCENFLWNRPDLDETISRLQAFGKAGADVLYAPGLRDLPSIRTVCASVGKPVNVLMGLSGATYSIDELADAGAKRISVGGALARASYGALVRAGREMSEKGTFTFAAEAIGFAELQSFFTGHRR